MSTPKDNAGIYDDATCGMPSCTHENMAKSRLQTEHTQRKNRPVLDHSNAHWFSLRTSSSSSGVKSFLILKYDLISSGVLPLMMSATVWQHSALQNTGPQPCSKCFNQIKQRNTHKTQASQ